jgi:hypothetical protein
MSHLSPEELLDIAEGARLETSAPHLGTCASCREQLAGLREMITAVEVDVPEPSPLFWDHLSARIAGAVAAEPARVPSWLGLGRLSWGVAGVMSVAMVVMAVSLTLRTSHPNNPPAAPVVVSAPAADASSGLSADDPSLSLLADLAGSLDWDTAAEAGITMDVGAADGALTELTDAERVELQRLLREAMSGSGV